MSERGPRGDHGQHGDTGDVGPAGRAGERGPEGHAGERGPIGDVGAVGPEGKSSRLATRSTLMFVILTLVFFAVLFGFSLVIAQNRNLAREGKEAHDALCIDRAELVRERDRGEKLLKEQPGDPIIVFDGFLVPRNEIQRSVDEHNEDIAALDGLDCVPPPPPKEE